MPARTHPLIQTPILIVGSGGNAMSTATMLSMNGVEDFRMITKDSDFGGAWYQNTYPGCEVDVPSYVYQISHAPGRWNKMFHPQKDLLAYFQNIGHEFALYQKTDFETELLEAEWDDNFNHWVVKTNKAIYHADFLLLATGFLEEKTPAKIDGLDSFTGRVFHSADWPEGYTGANDKIAVVGSGASAAQIVPAMQKVASKVFQFVRTPTYVIPKGNRDLTPEELLPDNFAQRALQINQEWEDLTEALLGKDLGIAKELESEALAFLKQEVSDPQLRRLLTPDHQIGCKRPIFSDDYYRSLTKENVEVISGAATAVTPEGIVTESGSEVEADTIVLATGFYFGGYILDRIKRRDGQSVMKYQAGHPRSYKAVSVSNCPNLFLIGGSAPNGQGWNGLYPGEAVGRYFLDVLDYMKRNQLASVEVRESAVLEWKKAADEILDQSAIVAGNCVSYSLDERGHNKAEFPGTQQEMGDQLSKFIPEDHIFVSKKR